MVYRIHFTPEDLARTRVLVSPPPLVETMLAVRWLQVRQPRRFAHWRGQVLPRLPHRARMVFDLVPARGYAPDFLVPKEPGDLAGQLELVLSTPRSVIRREMTHVALERPVPDWARRLDDDFATLRRLVESLGQLHATLTAPYWDQVTAQVAADRARRARDLVDRGVDGLLRGLYPPKIRWNAPVLEIHSGFTGELHLNGRGLLLIPSVFAGAGVSVGCDVEPQATLTYPAHHDGHTLLGVPGPAAPVAVARPVVTLLGRTRATVLQVISHGSGCTTSELAAAAGISASSASEHATVLRAAGLVTTTRRGRSVLHTATPSGLSLLGAAEKRTTARGGGW